MTNGEQEAVLEFEPVWVPEELIIIPLDPVMPKPDVPYVPYFEDPAKKRLIINLETTGLNPWQHRIIAIGLQDPLFPNENPSVLLLEEENLMLDLLFTIIKDGGYTEIVGYGCSFDFRFILLRAMFYNMDCREFYDMSLFDLMQAAGQGKFEFMYYAPRPPKLSDLADFLWQYPKPFSDLDMLKYWKLGQLDKVIEFTSSQITRIMALYQLFLKITTSTFIALPPGSVSPTLEPSISLSVNTASKLTIPEANVPAMNPLKCPSCLAEFNVPVNQAEANCPICGLKVL